MSGRPAATARPPLPLAILLVLLALGSMKGLSMALTEAPELLARYPRLKPLWVPYSSVPVLNLVAVVALWLGRRWGFWLACGLSLFVFGVELYAMGFGLHVIRVPLALALLVWFVRLDPRQRG